MRQPLNVRRDQDPSGATGDTSLVAVSGASAFAYGAEWLDRLQQEAGVSLLARGPWLQAWSRAFSDWEPWVLAVVDQGEPRAVAPLARRRVRAGVQVVAAGDSELAESPMAVGDGSADDLARGIVGALQGLRSPWVMSLRQLPIGSPLLTALTSALPVSTLFSGPRRPVLRFVDDRAPRRWLTRNTASALVKAQNRIGREAHRLDVGWIEAWDEIEAVLPELIGVHRARDLELRGASRLDDPRQARFYHDVIERHAHRWRLLVARIDGSMAAYALCLRDGGTLRVWDNRVAPRWARYSAGLIVNAELVLRSAADASVDELDWGCGEQRYKLSLSNQLIDAQGLTAWSSPVLRAGLVCRNRLRRLGRPASARPRAPPVQRALTSASSSE